MTVRALTAWNGLTHGVRPGRHRGVLPVVIRCPVRIVHFAVERTVATGLGGEVDYDDVRFTMLTYAAADLPPRALVRVPAPGR
ncbi:hypothetical protein LX83_004743 [Goodfellowiella coeruleoviolacea]|uniref:Uncharacterized protein n=1 Tax=Goodfellowiella coeruleoviolacea TaxID=334858 RepID=A0AAE3KHX4_9PSEU|nr:hypothetical protein [Goodfellowiella coeruleoviolacea]